MSLSRLVQFVGRCSVLCLLLVGSICAQSTAFTYQGRLTDAGAPASGPHDFRFRLYDLASAGTQQGAQQSLLGVTVSSGVFTVQLDFGASVFTANTARFLEIDVRAAGGPTYTTLPQRQPLSSTPYAVQTLNAAQLGGVAASQFVQTTDPRLTDARSPTGAAGGDLAGTYPSPTIAPGAVNDAKVANGISYSKLSGAPTSLPPSGAAGGDLTGTFPNPSILPGAIVNADVSATAAIASTKIAGLGSLATISPTGTPSATTYLRGDNSWAPVSGGAAPVFAGLSAAVTVSSSKPTYVNILTIALAANKTYLLDYDILGNRVGPTSGLGTGRLIFTGTGNSDYYLIGGAYLPPQSILANTGFFDQEDNAAAGNWATTVSNRYQGHGYIRTTSAGNLTVQVARASTNTTVDLSVKEGSFIIATPLN